jgi:hypothetical protein
LGTSTNLLQPGGKTSFVPSQIFLQFNAGFFSAYILNELRETLNKTPQLLSLRVRQTIHMEVQPVNQEHGLKKGKS